MSEICDFIMEIEFEIWLQTALFCSEQLPLFLQLIRKKLAGGVKVSYHVRLQALTARSGGMSLFPPTASVK